MIMICSLAEKYPELKSHLLVALQKKDPDAILSSLKAIDKHIQKEDLSPKDREMLSRAQEQLDKLEQAKRTHFSFSIIICANLYLKFKKVKLIKTEFKLIFDFSNRISEYKDRIRRGSEEKGARSDRESARGARQEDPSRQNSRERQATR